MKQDGVRGIYYETGRNKWVVKKMVNGVSHTSRHDSQEGAIEELESVLARTGAQKISYQDERHADAIIQAALNLHKIKYAARKDGLYVDTVFSTEQVTVEIRRGTNTDVIDKDRSQHIRSMTYP